MSKDMSIEKLDLQSPDLVNENFEKLATLFPNFFSCSGSTTYVVMKLNSEDNGRRKFIQVLLSEIIDEKLEAFKEGYNNLCEIGMKRIRRASKKIQEEIKANINYGFRIYLDDNKGIDENFAKVIVKDAPLNIVFRDNGFKVNTAKTNFKQLLKQLCPETEMKVF